MGADTVLTSVVVMAPPAEQIGPTSASQNNHAYSDHVSSDHVSSDHVSSSHVSSDHVSSNHVSSDHVSSHHVSSDNASLSDHPPNDDGQQRHSNHTSTSGRDNEAAQQQRHSTHSSASGPDDPHQRRRSQQHTSNTARDSDATQQRQRRRSSATSNSGVAGGGTTQPTHPARAVVVPTPDSNQRQPRRASLTPHSPDELSRSPNSPQLPRTPPGRSPRSRKVHPQTRLEPLSGTAGVLATGKWDITKISKNIVVHRRRLEHRKENQYASSSLYLLAPNNPFRVVCIRIIEKPAVDLFVLLLIVANCTFLAFSDPICESDFDNPLYLDHDCSYYHEKLAPVLDYGEITFTTLFSIEMVLKILAQGLVLHKYAYLRDGWNVLDCVVVVMSLVSFVPGVKNISSLRTVRVLRPLRTMSRIKGMRPLVTALLRSIGPLANVLLMCGFVFLTFGILGVQLFSGLLRGRCVYLDGPLRGLVYEKDRVCSVDEGGAVCPSFELVGAHLNCTLFDPNGGPYPNPSYSYGFINFDNILFAFLAIFQSISLEGWVDIMYLLEDAYVPVGARIYFVLLILLGTFFVINLALAVISESFSSTSKEEAIKSQELEQERLFEAAAAGTRSSVRASLIDKIKTIADTNSVGTTHAFPSLKRPLLARLRGHLRALVDSSTFRGVIMLLIFVNTVCLALEYHDQSVLEKELCRRLDCCRPAIKAVTRSDGTLSQPWDFAELLQASCGDLESLPAVSDLCPTADSCPAMPALLASTLLWMNSVLTAVFTLEMALKLLGLGLRGYISDAFNVFDGFIVLISLVELFAQGSGIISIFRAFRLFRVFKLARSWKSLRNILRTVASTVKSIAPLSAVLLLFMFIYALLGMQLFGGLFRFESDSGEVETTRSNFDSFFPGDLGFGALVTIFQILTGENWNEVMYNGMKATNELAAVYFIVLVVFGIYIIMNLFLAILLQGFSEDDERQAQEEEEEAAEAEAGLYAEPSLMSRWYDRARAACYALVYKLAKVSPEGPSPVIHTPDDSKSTDSKENMDDPISSLHVSQANMATQTDSQWRVFDLDRSLFLFSRPNRIRVWVTALVHHWLFDNFLLCCILASSVMLMVEHPLDEPLSLKTTIILYADYAFLGIFLLEMFLKMLSMGVLMAHGAYLLDPWNIVDCFIVISSLISSLGRPELKSLRALRAMRTLRPLRIIKHNNSLKISVNCLLRSIPSMLNVLVVCVLFFVVFGILGVQLFKGGFYTCSATHTPAGLPVVDVLDCMAVGGSWENRPYSFDDVLSALLCLFEVATLEGWLSVMMDGIDSVGPGRVGVYQNMPIVVLYFIAFIVVGSFFVLNLFIGVVIDNYNDIKRESDVGAYLTKGQKDWVDAQKNILTSVPRPKARPPSFVLFRWCHRLVTWPGLDACVLVVISLNLLIMSTDSFDLGRTDYALFLEYANITFTAVFTLEMLVKILGLGPKGCFKDGWNRFDLLVVLGSLIGVFYSEIPGSSVLRVFRIARLFRLIKTAKGLRQLFETLMYSLPSLANVGSLLLLMYSIFGVLGVTFFFNVQLHQDSNDWLNEHANFQTFWTTIITLFRMSTGESWNGLMHYCMRGLCEDPSRTDGCGGSAVAVVYFISFNLFCTFIMLNLFIAVILDNFNEAHENAKSMVPKELLAAFQQAWSELDQDAVGHIPTWELESLLELLPVPMGVKGRDVSKTAMLRLITQLNIPEHSGLIYYHAAFHALTDYAMSGNGVVTIDQSTRDAMEAEKKEKLSDMGLHEPGVPVAESFAARAVQRSFQQWKRNRASGGMRRASFKLLEQARQQAACADDDGHSVVHAAARAAEEAEERRKPRVGSQQPQQHEGDQARVSLREERVRSGRVVGDDDEDEHDCHHGPHHSRCWARMVGQGGVEHGEAASEHRGGAGEHSSALPDEKVESTTSAAGVFSGRPSRSTSVGDAGGNSSAQSGSARTTGSVGNEILEIAACAGFGDDADDRAAFVYRRSPRTD